MSLLNNCYLNFNYFTEASSLSFYSSFLISQPFIIGNDAVEKDSQDELFLCPLIIGTAAVTAVPEQQSPLLLTDQPHRKEKKKITSYIIYVHISTELYYTLSAPRISRISPSVPLPPPLLCNKNYIRRTTNCQRPYKKRC